MITIATNMMTILAQTNSTAGPPATSPSGAGSGLPGGMMVPIIIAMIVFFFFSMRSKQKGDKQRQALLGAMKRGDRVQTIGGVLGTIVEVRDTEIVVKVDESNNTKIKFARSAIQRVIGEEDKTEAK